MGSNKSAFSISKWHELATHDIQQIYQIRSDVFVLEQKCIYPVVDHIDLKASHLLGSDGKEIIAYARVYEDDNFWYIGRVIVKASSRGSGIGKSLMKFLLNQLAKQNTSKRIIKISAQVYLSSFYQSLGFSPVGSMYLEDGIPHLEMVFNLRWYLLLARTLKLISVRYKCFEQLFLYSTISIWGL